jgi:DNA gyrase/topoisomerase IV subunit B
MSKTNNSNSKEIIALDNFAAVRLRPTLYVGQISDVEEKYPLIINNKLFEFEKKYSPGFYQLFFEIFENSIDEAKRCKGKMKNIIVKVNLDTNEITIIDEGLGFHNAAKKHKKTKKNVVRTALEELHAGSNFVDTESNLLGTFGLGASIVNILSEHFTVETINKTHYVRFVWNNFEVIDKEIRKKESNETIGTKISFIPSKEMFPNYKWDKDLITTYLSFKAFLIKNDSKINKLNLCGSFIEDGKETAIPIVAEFIPKNNIVISNNFGIICLWETYENSGSLSFVNGSQCTGIHQKIVNDWVNEYFKYNLAHHFYETLIILNVPSTLMRFSDQNKTKYAVGRWEIEDLMKQSFHGKFIRLLSRSNIARNIEQCIEDRLHNENMSKIKRAQRQSKRKISDKFSPSSKYKENIYITEGLCIEENTKIFIIRKNKIRFCKLKDVKIGDHVITHKNNIKPITYINKSLKNAYLIKTSIEDIKCSNEHKWFVYDRIENTFYFEQTGKLDKTRHQLVKNYLSFLQSFDEIITINTQREKIEVVTDKGEEWMITKNMNVCVFDEKNDKFVMKNSNDLTNGDIIPKFVQ